MSSLPKYATKPLTTAVHHDVSVRSSQCYTHTKVAPQAYTTPAVRTTSDHALIGRDYRLAMHHCNKISQHKPNSGLGMQKHRQMPHDATALRGATFDARILDGGNYKPGRGVWVEV